MTNKEWIENRNKLFRLRGLANQGNTTNLFLEMKKVIPQIQNEDVREDLEEAYRTSPSETNKRKELINKALSKHLRSV